LIGRRTLTFSNSDSQEEVESSPNEYIDYRNFPLNIDWFDVEDENSEACKKKR